MEIWLKLLMIVGIMTAAAVIVLSLAYRKRLKSSDYIFNGLLALFIGVTFIYFLVSDKVCYTCSAYNDYILFAGLLLLSLWMLYDVINDIRKRG